MPYSINRLGERFVVTSPKGKQWKTTYPSLEAAQKAVAYVEGRFGGSGISVTPAPAAEEEDPDTSKERTSLGIPARPGPEDDTEGW